MGSHSAKHAAEHGQAIYEADNSESRFETSGICYRNSKDIQDRKEDGQTLPWGCSIAGVDEGDDWLRVRSSRVKSYYLPMKVQGFHIMKKVKDDHSDSAAPHIFAPSDSHQPDDFDPHQMPVDLAPVVQKCAELADDRRLRQLEDDIRRLEDENAELGQASGASFSSVPAPPPAATPDFHRFSGELASLEEALARKRAEMADHDLNMDRRRNDLAGHLNREEERLREQMQIRIQEEERQIRLREEAKRAQDEAHHHHRQNQRQEDEARLQAEHARLQAEQTRLRDEHEQATERLRHEHEQLNEALRAEHERLRIEHEQERSRLERETQGFRDRHREAHGLEAHGLERLQQEHEEERRRLEAEMHQFRELHRVEQDKLRREQQQRMQEEALLHQQREEARRDATRREEMAREEAARQEWARREEEEAAARKRREEAARRAEEARQEEEEVQRRRQQLDEDFRKQREEEARRIREQHEEEDHRRRARDEEMLRFKREQTRAAEERQRREWQEHDWRRREHSGTTPYTSSPVRSHLFDHRHVDRGGAFTPRSPQGFEASSLSSTGVSAYARSPGAPPSNGHPYSIRGLRDVGGSVSSNSSVQGSGKRHQINNLLADLDKLAGDLQSVFTTKKSGSPPRASSLAAGPTGVRSPRSWASSHSPTRNRG
mmetsp:Transcript_123001/g.213401  ORF Transcript_123001/g.213401 Transcript_123001/m.213401 type:complete len:663 (-) Transcript_123001:123-2111(-)